MSFKYGGSFKSQDGEMSPTRAQTLQEEPLFREGVELFDAGDFSSAVSKFTSILAPLKTKEDKLKENRYVHALIYRSRCFESMERWDDLLIDGSELVDLYSDRPDGKFLLSSFSSSFSYKCCHSNNHTNFSTSL
jgi:hypothetical protein